MKIDGYVKPDADISLKQGVSFTYPTPYGDITIRSKMAGRDNVPFKLAMANFDSWQTRRRSLKAGSNDDEADEKLLGIVYDNLVIAWETSIRTDGNPIEPTRANFIELLKSQAVSNVFGVYMTDAADAEQFRPTAKEEERGN